MKVVLEILDIHDIFLWQDSISHTKIFREIELTIAQL